MKKQKGSDLVLASDCWECGEKTKMTFKRMDRTCIWRASCPKCRATNISIMERP